MTYIEKRQVLHRLQAVDPRGIAAIHDATVRVLSETGVVYEDEEVLELLSAAGAVANDEGVVKIPEALLGQAIESAPSAILMHSRGGRGGHAPGAGLHVLRHRIRLPLRHRFAEG